MAGQRRYGTTKSGKLAGLRGNNGDEASNSAARTKGKSKIPLLLSGDRGQKAVPEGQQYPLLSEREPLLVGSASDRDAGGGRRGSSGGTASAAAGAFASGSSRRDNGKALTTLLVLNYMIGSGILNAPQVFQASGIGPATILYIIAAFAVWVGIVVLVNASEVAFPRGYMRGVGVSDSSNASGVSASSRLSGGEVKAGTRAG
ncbi:unnamed protein product, partial [Scytosiphon promiscuus]